MAFEGALGGNHGDFQRDPKEVSGGFWRRSRGSARVSADFLRNFRSIFPTLANLNCS